MKCKAAITILLGVIYLTAIIGFDVHINYHDGEVFVVSLLGRTDCESLHPDDHCHCLAHHCGHCHEDDEDCENIAGFISITGDGYDLVFDFQPAISESLSPEMIRTAVPVASEYFSSSCCAGPPREKLRNLCVLRV